MYCNLIVTRPFNQVFTYDTGNTKVKKGQIAIVPVGKSIEIGMIVEISNVYRLMIQMSLRNILISLPIEWQ